MPEERPDCNIYIDGDYLHIEPPEPFQAVFVHLDRIRTPEQLIAWMLHYNQKVYMDKLSLRLLASTVADHRGWSIYNAR